VSHRLVGYRTYRNALALGVTLSIGRAVRLVAVRILLLIGVFILSFSGVGAVKADEHSPASPSETSTTTGERQRVLPAWTEGSLYIHHISTGRGNASYFVMPDGTTMLIDAGEADPSFIASVAPLKAFPQRPDAAHSAGFWIADYIRHFAPAGRPLRIDYALLTHFHTDHIGTITPSSPASKAGPYRLAGITEVADLISIGVLIDRSGPPYVIPVDLHDCKDGGDAKSVANYLSFAESRVLSGKAVVGLHAGQLDQIRLHQPDRYPEFHIRNVAASGVIWTGRGDETEQYIPLNAVKDCHFDENPFSNVIRLSYGEFSYYSGGDIPGVPDYTQPFWRDIETPVAAVVGPVDVMTLDHHGNRDSTNGGILRALRPRVIIQQNWLSAQPGEEVVVRMASHEFYPGPRDVFSTGMSPETRIAIGPIMDRIYKSYEGHVVVRVAPGGMTYEVFVLDDKDIQRKVIAYFGPYRAD
jgi:beta-lactamase superfamily II metal-dependent hydrolase